MNRKIKYRIAIGYPIAVLFAGIIFYSCNRQVSVTPPDALPPNGMIFVNSDPEGFEIYLDGKPKRRATPDSIKWLKTGTYTVTLKKDLFDDTTVTVKAVEGQRVKVFIDFAHSGAMQGSIYCDSSPEKAEIFINDSSTGSRTPATIYGLVPGIYNVRLHLQNHGDYVDTVTVSSRSFSKVNGFLIDTTIWRDLTTRNSSLRTNDFTCINVDQNDVVWAGTDGYGVISWDGNVIGGQNLFTWLPNKYVTCIVIDPYNTKFVGTKAGMLTYDGVNISASGAQSEGNPATYIEAMGFDSSDAMYTGTKAGLTKQYIANNRFYLYTYPDSVIPDPIISAILCDNENNVWVGMNSRGVVELRPDGTWDWTRKDNSHIISDNVRAIAESPTGEIWVGFASNVVYGGGLSYYNGTSWQNVNVIPSTSQTNEIYIDRNNTKWVATDQGLVKFNSIADVTLFNKQSTGLNINDVTGVAGDSKGNIWISTYGGGLVEYKGNH